MSKSNTIQERIFTKADVKWVKSLGDRINRYTNKLFVAEGSKSVLEIVNSGASVNRILATESWMAEYQLQLPPHTVYSVINEKELAAMSSLRSTRAVIGVFNMPTFRFEPSQLKGLTLVLDSLQDPGNLGTLIRLADWYGISDILCSVQTVDCYNTKTVQASMASISRVKVHYGDLYEMIKAAALPVYAAIMEGEASRKVKFPKDVLLVIGNEGQGVSPAVLKLKSKGISIEKRGLAESLNAAMAGAILLDRYFGQFD